MMDILGKPLLDTTVTATNKLWWPHCEALYACTLAYERSGDTSWLEWLAKIDKFCYEVRSIPSWILFHRLVVRLLRSPQRLHFNCSHPFSLTRDPPPPPPYAHARIPPPRVHTSSGPLQRLCDRDNGGEWLGYLNRDGTPFNKCKGGNYKGCFHVPRSLLFSYRAARRAVNKAK
jgi:hypothetical protein